MKLQEQGQLGVRQGMAIKIFGTTSGLVVCVFAIGGAVLMLDDVTINALQAAMHGLSARQSAISQDISNVNTPYYRARSVTFEGDLRRALENGDNPLSVQPATQYSQVDGGLDGNNVDLDAETVSSVQTEMSFELALRATGDRFSLINAAIKGS